MPDLTQINNQIMKGISLKGILSGLGVIIIALILLGGFAVWYWWYWNRKQFNKVTTDFEIVGDSYTPERRDRAKLVRLGKGGFQLLYLQKAKVYRIVFGGKIGKNAYYFFIGKDGYPYNCTLSSEITADGKIPIKTTNALMRAQYTALEKLVEDLYKAKSSFWEKYGNWVMTIAFVLIIGVLAWLIYREMNSFWGQANTILDHLAEMMKQIKEMQNAVPVNPNSGIYKVG